MKHSILILSSLPLLNACSNLDDLVSRNVTDSELPGVPTQINCNPDPVLVYSKAGDLIEAVAPVLHPSCRDNTSAGIASEDNASRWSSLFGPARARTIKRNEATDDDFQFADVTPAVSNEPAPTHTGSLAAVSEGSTAEPDRANSPSTSTDTTESEAPKGSTDPQESTETKEPTKPSEPSGAGTPGGTKPEPPHEEQEEEHEETHTPNHEDKCNDPDDCHDHPDHDPYKNDNAKERKEIHGLDG